MPRVASRFGLAAKWLGAPLVCAALGYFFVGPRMVRKPTHPQPSQHVASNTTPKSVAQLEPTPHVDAPKPSASTQKPAPTVDVTLPDDTSAAPTTSGADEKPDLEITTDRPKPRSEPAPVRKRSTRKKVKKVATQPTATPTKPDPASNAVPEVPKEAPSTPPLEPSAEPQQG